MRRLLVLVVMVALFTLASAGTALAHPGDATDTGYAKSFAQTGGPGFDIPAPNGEGLANPIGNGVFTEAEVGGDHPVSNSVTRNPMCGAHRASE